MLRHYQQIGVIPIERAWDKSTPQEVFYKVDVDRIRAAEKKRQIRGRRNNAKRTRQNRTCAQDESNNKRARPRVSTTVALGLVGRSPQGLCQTLESDPATTHKA